MFYLIKNRGEKLYEANSIGLWSLCNECHFFNTECQVVMQLKERLSGQKNPLQMHSVFYTNVQSLITTIIVVINVLNFPVKHLLTSKIPRFPMNNITNLSMKELQG